MNSITLNKLDTALQLTQKDLTVLDKYVKEDVKDEIKALNVKMNWLIGLLITAILTPIALFTIQYFLKGMTP
jgi:hypothetical protein